MKPESLHLALDRGMSADLVDRLHAGVRALAASQGVSQELRPQLELVVEELCTNVMEHSGAAWLELSLACEQGRVWVRINDNGRPFDVLEGMQGSRFDLSKVEDRHLGLYMVEQLTRTIRRSRDAQGINRVEFEIHPDPDSGA